MALQEINELWDKADLGDKIDEELLEENTEMKVYIKFADFLLSNGSLLKLFLFAEADYDIDKASSLLENIRKKTDLARYLHLKFDDVNLLIEIWMNLEPGIIDRYKD